MTRIAVAALAALTACATSPTDASAAPPKLLVVTVTKGFRHESIPTAEKLVSSGSRRRAAPSRSTSRARTRSSSRSSAPRAATPTRACSSRRRRATCRIPTAGLRRLDRGGPRLRRHPLRDRHLPRLRALHRDARGALQAPRPAGEGRSAGEGRRAPVDEGHPAALRGVRRDLPVREVRPGARASSSVHVEAPRERRARRVPPRLDARPREGPRVLHGARPPRGRARRASGTGATCRPASCGPWGSK